MDTNFHHSVKIEINAKEGKWYIYIRDETIAKRLETLEGKHTETVCLELTVSKKKCCITFAYRSPSNDNKATFFNELTTSLSQIANLYDYYVVMGDLNI